MNLPYGVGGRQENRDYFYDNIWWDESGLKTLFYNFVGYFFRITLFDCEIKCNK